VESTVDPSQDIPQKTLEVKGDKKRVLCSIYGVMKALAKDNKPGADLKTKYCDDNGLKKTIRLLGKIQDRLETSRGSSGSQ